MASKLDLTKADLYGTLGVNEDATEKEILKAYRKQALKCHPDKNPDNPKAAEQFHQLTEALEILTDAAARAAFDKILKSKKAAELRRKQYDSKRKKFKDDLDAREQAASEQKEDSAAAERRLQAEVMRLRREGSKILADIQEVLMKDLEQSMAQQDNKNRESDQEDQTNPKLKVKWKIKKGETRDEGYTKEEMMDLFTKYGEVLNLVMSVKKSGTAIVEYAATYMAELAVLNVTGKQEFPLTLSWLSGAPSDRSRTTTGMPSDRSGATQEDSSQNPTFTASFTLPSFTSASSTENKDFESVVLMKMRQAEERKRMIEQMMKEDEEGT